MAPSKRAAAPPARPAKVAKREEPNGKQAPSAEQPEKICPKPVVAILDKLHITVSEPVVAMLQAGMPYILSTKPEDRHAYQVNTLRIWDELVKEVDAKFISDVDAAEAHCSAIAEEKATRDDKLQKAREVEAELLIKKQEAEAKSTEKENASSQAAAVAATQNKLLEEGDAVLQAKIDERTSYVQALTETWEPVKANSFAGKDWRLRNKAIDRLSSLLDKAAASAALAASLPVALKERLESRGPFTTHVIEAGEVAFQEHLQLLQTQEDELRAARTAQSEVLAKADEAAAEKAQARDEALQASIDAQNAWVDANSVVFGLDNDNIEQKEAAAAAALQVARDTLNCFREHVIASELLAKPPSSPAPECTAEQMLNSTITECKEVTMAEPASSAEGMAVSLASLHIAADPVLAKVAEDVPASISLTRAACGA